MDNEKLSGDEIARRAKDIYRERIQADVEPSNVGKLLIVNVDTGEYDLDTDNIALIERAMQRFPGANLFTLRVGYATAYTMGGQLKRVS